MRARCRLLNSRSVMSKFILPIKKTSGRFSQALRKVAGVNYATSLHSVSKHGTRKTRRPRGLYSGPRDWGNVDLRIPLEQVAARRRAIGIRCMGFHAGGKKS